MPSDKKKTQIVLRKRKTKKSYKTLVNLKSLQPIAQRYITKLKYAEVVTVNLGTAAFGTLRMNLNSLYDPNQSGIGHQPYGFDQLATLYNRYRVIGCKYKINAISTGYYQLAALPGNDVISVSNVSEAREQPRCRYVLQAPNAPMRILSGYVSIPSLFGRTKQQYMADDRYQSVYNNSPSELAILNIFAGTASEAGGTENIYLNVEMEYLVEFFDQNRLPQS